jgi:hypothetical protein
MTEPTIKAALEAAAKQFCICDGECFETRHGMMNGPCEAMIGQAATAIAAFLRALPMYFEVPHDSGSTWGADWRILAAAVERTAREGGG